MTEATKPDLKHEHGTRDYVQDCPYCTPTKLPTQEEKLRGPEGYNCPYCGIDIESLGEVDFTFIGGKVHRKSSCRSYLAKERRRLLMALDASKKSRDRLLMVWAEEIFEQGPDGNEFVKRLMAEGVSKEEAMVVWGELAN